MATPPSDGIFQVLWPMGGPKSVALFTTLEGDNFIFHSASGRNDEFESFDQPVKPRPE